MVHKSSAAATKARQNTAHGLRYYKNLTPLLRRPAPLPWFGYKAFVLAITQNGQPPSKQVLAHMPQPMAPALFGSLHSTYTHVSLSFKCLFLPFSYFHCHQQSVSTKTSKKWGAKREKKLFQVPFLSAVINYSHGLRFVRKEDKSRPP